VKVNFRMFGRIKQLCGGYQKESWSVVALRTNGSVQSIVTGFLVIKHKKCVFARNHFGKKRNRRFGRLRQTKTMPENSTWYVMTEMTGLNYKDVGNLYGCRNWVEYGLNQSKMN